jgi:hypothetical protein
MGTLILDFKTSASLQAGEPKLTTETALANKSLKSFPFCGSCNHRSVLNLGG